MSLSYAPTIESTLSLITMVPSWLGVIGTRARCLFKKSCLWDSNKLRAAREISWEIFVISWTTSLKIRITESGPKPKNYSKPLLETEKSMFHYCRLKVYKLRMQMNFWLTVSTNGESTRSCHKWNDFFFFYGTGWGVLDCDWWRKSLKNGVGFFS